MRKDRIFFIINETNEALSLSNYPRQILNLVLNVLSKLLDVDASWVHLADATTREEALSASRGLTSTQNRELMAPELRGILEDRLGTGDLVIVPDMARDDKLKSSPFVGAGFGSLVAVPLVTDRFRGTLGTMWRVTKGFDADYGFLLLVIGNLVCSTLERAALYERMLGKVDSEPQIKYDIEEFEKLVALAEQYSRATRLAIEEAVVRAKGSEATIPVSLALLGEGSDYLLPGELTGQGDGGEVPSAASGPEDEVAAVGEENEADASGPATPPEAATEAPPVTNAPLNPHEQRMKSFIKHHPYKRS
jgi:hypothetical protein